MVEQYDKRATGQKVTSHILVKKKKRLSPLRVHRIEDIFNTEGHWRQTFSCLVVDFGYLVFHHLIHFVSSNVFFAHRSRFIVSDENKL